jgi:hypothetical protein
MIAPDRCDAAKGSKIPWIIQIKPGETLTVNGARLAFPKGAKVCLLDQARVVLPDGRVREATGEDVAEKEHGHNL